MPLYKFKDGDVFRNRLKAYPKSNFTITAGSLFYNNEFPEIRTLDPGDTNYLNHVPRGSISLYVIGSIFVTTDTLVHSTNNNIMTNKSHA